MTYPQSTQGEAVMSKKHHTQPKVEAPEAPEAPTAEAPAAWWNQPKTFKRSIASVVQDALDAGADRITAAPEELTEAEPIWVQLEAVLGEAITSGQIRTIDIAAQHAVVKDGKKSTRPRTAPVLITPHVIIWDGLRELVAALNYSAQQKDAFQVLADAHHAEYGELASQTLMEVKASELFQLRVLDATGGGGGVGGGGKFAQSELDFQAKLTTMAAEKPAKAQTMANFYNEQIADGIGLGWTVRQANWVKAWIDSVLPPDKPA